jgi:hypothetical protein
MFVDVVGETLTQRSIRRCLETSTGRAYSVDDEDPARHADAAAG